MSDCSLRSPESRWAVDFVVACRRNACLLAPPQHGGARFALFAAQLAKRCIGDASHGRQHDWRVNAEAPYLNRLSVRIQLTYNRTGF